MLLPLDLAEETGVVDREDRLRGERLERGNDVGRKASALASQDDEASEQSILADERQGEQGAQPLPGQESPHLGRNQLRLVLDVSHVHRFPNDAGATDGALAEPDRRLAQEVQLLGGDLVRGPRVERANALVELVDDAAVAAGQLDGPAHDRRQHGVEIERGADRATHFTKRLEFAHRARQLARACLQLREQPRVLDGDHDLVGEGLEDRDLLVREEMHLGAAESHRADRHAFPDQRDTERGPVTPLPRRFAAFRIFLRLGL